jgi:hypothetical protein
MSPAIPAAVLEASCHGFSTLQWLLPVPSAVESVSVNPSHSKTVGLTFFQEAGLARFDACVRMSLDPAGTERVVDTPYDM